MAAVAVGRDHADQGQPLAKSALATHFRTTTAVQAEQGQPIPAPGATPPATPPTGVAGFGQLLVAQIPSEALVAYTTLIALFSASGGVYQAGLWAVYGAAIVVCGAAVLAGYLAQRTYGFADTDGDAKTPTEPNPPVPALITAVGPDTVAITAAGAAVPPGPGQGSGGSASAAAAGPAAGGGTGLHLPILPACTAMLAMAVYGLTVPGSPLQSAVSGPAFGIWAGCLAVGGGIMMSIFAPFLGRGNAAVPKQKQG